MKYALLLFSLFTPTITHAALEISEVAWMGSAASANHEWIELYNDGSALIVDGWTISDGTNLQIELAGTIPAASHVVLERTSDASAPGSAFLIYTGALVNTGTTLTLRDNVGQIVDQVAGGEDWERIGGDNETKETAQRSQSGWVTAPATPGVAYLGVTTVTTEELTTADTRETKITTKTTAKNKTEQIKLTLPDVTLQLDITAPEYAHVNQPVTFTVDASDIGDTLIDSLQYTWNFGDGTTATGKDISHTFAYPGRYVVVVEGHYKRQKQVARFEIDIYPIDVTLEQHSDGSVSITNNSDAEIDLSGYRLVGHQTVELPTYTILLPGEGIRLPSNAIGTSQVEAMVALYDQAGAVAAMALPGRTILAATGPLAVTSGSLVERPTPRISATSDTRVIDQSPNPRNTNRFSFAGNQPTSVTQTPLAASVVLAADEPAITQLAAADQTGNPVPNQWPLYVLIGVLLLGIVSVYLIPTYSRGED